MADAAKTNPKLGSNLASNTGSASVGSATPSLSVVAVDLLALAMGALVAWLGGEFVLSREAPAERRRTRRLRPQGHFRHKTV